MSIEQIPLPPEQIPLPPINPPIDPPPIRVVGTFEADRERGIRERREARALARRRGTKQRKSKKPKRKSKKSKRKSKKQRKSRR